MIHCFQNSDQINYIPAPREDIAVSLSFGYALSTGKLPLVIMQNSGIGTSLDAIITEPVLYNVPILFLVTWRGFFKKGIDSIGIKCFELNSSNQYSATNDAIEYSKNTNKSSAILLKRNVSIYENS